MKKKSEYARLRAVALRYDQEEHAAPKVVAKGAGIVAERIIALALEHGIHVHEDPDLTVLLAKLDLDTHIPQELYRAVAEVLAFVYRVNRQVGGTAR